MGENVFLFIPNLIGYARIILAVASFYYMPTDCVVAVTLYILSGLLDAFDGQAARMYNQSTKFGSMLDMLTDRCVTASLQMMLGLFYPKYLFLFQLLLCLDISSHWIHCQSGLLKGSANHKMIDLTGNPMLKIYYTSRLVLFIMCSGNELFFCMLYIVHFTSGPQVSLGSMSFGLWVALAWIFLPICILKQCISLIQLTAGCINTSRVDVADRAKTSK